MASLMGQRGYFPTQQNRFSPIQQQGTNSIQRWLEPSPGQQQILTPASQAKTQPVVLPISQPVQSASPVQKQIPLLTKLDSSSTTESPNLWQQQAGILMKQYGPSLIRQFGPPLARKVGLPIAQHLGPPLARRVGMPLVQRIGLPLARKLFLPLVKRAGFALIRGLGLGLPL